METEQINSMIARHFSKETNPAEELLVCEWIKSNPKEYLSLKVLWADSLVLQYQYLFVTDMAWDKVIGQITKDKELNRSLKKYSKTSYWLAAVSIFLIACAALFFYATSSVTISTQLTEVRNVTLSDGTSVTLNGNSSIIYPRYFMSKRNITLDGEAFFDVKHDAKHPFVVHTRSFLVNVLGTSFLVNSFEQTMFVRVKSGKVAVKDEKSIVSSSCVPEKV